MVVYAYLMALSLWLSQTVIIGCGVGCYVI